MGGEGRKRVVKGIGMAQRSIVAVDGVVIGWMDGDKEGESS